ncbi:MAG: hypothetical protein HY235_02020 [Acidobacteria bacterium]|nr:hypothetical protein [Acidobacteriota bacterium]
MLIIRLACALVLVAVFQSAQPLPLTRGVFQGWTGTDSSGSFLLETPDKQSHRCSYTSRTHFEREQRRTAVSTIQTGQTLDVLSERSHELPLCRALIVRIVNLEQPFLHNTRRSVLMQYQTDVFVPRGNVFLAGVVLRAEQDSILLRTRSGSRYLVMLRKDTRFADSGMRSERDRLPFSRPVYVRAGRNLDNDLEAYSVVWGDILKP